MTEREECLPALDVLLRIEPPDIRKAYGATVALGAHTIEPAGHYNRVRFGAPKVLNRVHTADLTLDAEKVPDLLRTAVRYVCALVKRLRREKR